MSTIKIAAVCLILSLWGAVAHAGTVTYVYSDPQGTPLAEADASGNITARFDYTPYGVAVASMGPAPNGPGYTGHVNDPETGLVYMQARYYDPAAGRFLSVDPVGPSVGDTFGVNRYAYANNNPIVNMDPDGRETGIAFHSEFVMMGGKAQHYQSPNDTVGQALQVAFSVMPVIGGASSILNAIANPSAASISAAAIGALPVVGGVAADAVKGGSAFERATVIAGTMSTRTRRSVTIAVTETEEGPRVVSSSEGALRRGGRAKLASGEVEGRGTSGTHAEVNGINAARSMGLNPTGTAASRGICPSCAQVLKEEGVTPLSPLKKE